MKTYQDLLAVSEDEQERIDFVRMVIAEHKSSDLYKKARIAQTYFRKENATIRNYQKILYTITGLAVPDNYSANWKMKHGFFHRFIVQEVQHLLSNGVTWKNSRTRDMMGDNFDTRLQKAAKDAAVCGVSYCFWNLDHIEEFPCTEFAGMYDEEDGALKAGVRFWQIDDRKPLRATLYEPDGYTEYIWRKSEGSVLREKRPYILKVRQSEADGTEIYDFQNYPDFPIVPLYANQEHESELTGLREQIDCYDLIKSGFANDVDDASMIYWTIQNAGGMDDIDLAKFVERMKTVHAAVVDDDGAKAEAHTLEVPYASRDSLLDRLKRDLYQDAMALDVENIASGAITATQIQAAYEPLDSKCDDLEYCVLEFLQHILYLAGITDEDPSFTRSYIINRQEEINAVVSASQFLDEEYCTRKILTIFGDGDQADEIIKRMDADELERGGNLFAESPQAASNAFDGNNPAEEV